MDEAGCTRTTAKPSRSSRARCERNFSFRTASKLAMKHAILFVLMLSTSASAQMLARKEAADCKIVCKAGMEAAPNLFATNQKTTPAFWGREVGDSVSWVIDLKTDVAEPRLMVRYSYAAGHYRGFAGAEAKRLLHLIVDEEP